MPFDAIFLSAVTQELQQPLQGAKVDKIYQPERDTLVLQLRGSQGANRPPPAAADSAEPGKPGPAADVLHAAAQALGRRPPAEHHAAADGAGGLPDL